MDPVSRTMSRGDSLIFPIQVLQPVPGSPGSTPVPIDITGWFLWFTAKYYYTDPDVRAVSQVTTLSGGIVVTEAPTGKARVTMPPLATRAFPDGPVKLVYDVQAKDLTGNIFTIETGDITVFPDVTRAIV